MYIHTHSTYIHMYMNEMGGHAHIGFLWVGFFFLVMMMMIMMMMVMVILTLAWAHGSFNATNNKPKAKSGTIDPRSSSSSSSSSTTKHKLWDKAAMPLPLPSPPGSLPLIGHLHHLVISGGSSPHRWLHDVALRHGPLLSLRFGSVPVLVVSSPAMAQEVLQSRDLAFASRPLTFATDVFSYHGSGLAFAAYGPYWRKVKELYMTKLFNVTRLKDSEAVRVNELTHLVSSIWADREAPQEIRTKLFSMSFNNIFKMMFGKSCPNVSPILGQSQVRSLKELIEESLSLGGMFNIGDYLPHLQWLNLQGYVTRVKDTSKEADSLLQQFIDDRRQQVNAIMYDGENTTILDTLLFFEQYQGSKQAMLKDDQIKAMIWELFGGGSDTSIIVVEWAMAELLRNQHMLRALKEELDSIIGKDRLMKESDIPSLPFLRAIIKETMRLHPPAPLLLPYETREACEVGGFYIPEKTRTIVNAWAIARDESAWEKPFEFLPHRFLNSTIDVKGHHFQLLPFGAGRRACPGMNLGLVTSQLLLGTLIHCFDWSLPPDIHQVDMNEKFGLTLPKAIPLVSIATPRLSNEVFKMCKFDLS